MKYLKGLNKLIEGLLFLLLPLVVFYWSLTLIKFDIVKPFISILGSFIDPMMLPFKTFIEYKVYYTDYTIDYTILIFAGIVLVTAFLFTINGHLLNFVEEIINRAKIQAQLQENLKKQEEAKQEYLKEVNRYQTIYVLLKLIKNEPNASYLIKKDENDFFSAGIVDSYESSLSNAYKKFSARHVGAKSIGHNMHGYIFTNLNKFLEYLPFFMGKLEEVNKGMLDLNIKFEYEIACHCSYSDSTSDVDFEIASKILNLCGKQEILLSELLKNRLELLENSNFKLHSRGIYLIHDKQMDVYKLQFDD